ncbi:MAG TPA: S53 family peptidase [Verrucomicrobiae bacterium]|nr:S53 family peptidase [Verrucomicrobiae bacterium]
MRFYPGIIFSALLLSSFHLPAQDVNKQILRGHVPAIVSHLKPTGKVAATRQLNLSIGLPLRSQSALETFIAEVSDPSSPDYRHYLTPEQFAAQFGPTEDDYRELKNFFRANGFTVTGESPNRLLLDVRGSAADVERTFHVALRTYRHPTENRTFFAPDTEPSIDSSVRILDVNGLTDLPRPHSKVIVGAVNETVSGAPKGGAGSGPTGNYVGGDLRNAYAPGVSLTGAGQTVALVQFDGYYSKDITNYENFIGIAPANYVPLTNVLIDGFNGLPTGANNANLEVSLDIEMVISMAPGVSKIILYEGNPSSFFPNDVLNKIATDNLASQVSSSWGWSGGPDATTEQIFKQMIAQGQTYFNASGDSDAFITNQVDNPPLPNQPSASTNITQVGGTTLLSTNSVSETVWNWGGGSGSSGGISFSNVLPTWQSGIATAANHGSPAHRNIPDVAMVGDNIFVKYGNGLNATNVGGTSVAAPLWAGFTALINQKAAQAGRPPVGFINPAIYAIGKGPNYTSDFNDVTSGNNYWSSSPTNYPAVAGYDLCTGWGTPKGNSLITALAIPDALFITPGSGFTAVGAAGGPFLPTSQTFLLTNTGAASLNWVFLDPSNLLGAAPSGGTLAAGGATTVAVQLGNGGLNLLPGIYSSSFTFSNLTSGVGQEQQFSLQIGQSYIQDSGFEGGDFTNFGDWTFVGTGFSGGTLYNGVVTAGTFTDNYGTNFIHSGLSGVVLGEAGQLAYLYETIPTIPGQTYLVSFWLNERDGATPNQFVVNWNTNWPATNTIYNVSNFGYFDWTNYLFIVSATRTNTVLQFGAQNDSGYFGLDDVYVYPIPSPSLRSIAVTNNSTTFTWNSFTNLAYRIQYSTNLATGNWITLGTNKASGSISSTNTATVDPQRFYRIQRLP